jgi:hypothetical protein
MSVFLQPIYTQTVGSGGAASVTFNNIPQTFTDLKIALSLRETTASYYLGTYVSINNDASSLYSTTIIEGFGSVSSSRTSGQTSLFPVPHIPGSTATTNTFGNAEIYLPNYTSSNFKSLIIDAVSENNASTTYYFENGLSAGLYRSTNAVTSIKILAAGTFAQYSTVTLYGVLRQGI